MILSIHAQRLSCLHCILAEPALSKAMSKVVNSLATQVEVASAQLSSRQRAPSQNINEAASAEQVARALPEGKPGSQAAVDVSPAAPSPSKCPARNTLLCSGRPTQRQEGQLTAAESSRFQRSAARRLGLRAACLADGQDSGMSSKRQEGAEETASNNVVPSRRDPLRTAVQQAAASGVLVADSSFDEQQQDQASPIMTASFDAI